MRCSIALLSITLAAPQLLAQRHSGSPPTAPPRAPAPAPIAPVSSGMGAIQFVAVSYGVPAPQSLTRQLRIDDDRTRAAALSAVGAPGQYLQRGHIAMPRSIQLEFAELGTDSDLDAILTVELDQHIVTAILVPDGDNWRRVATVFVANSFDDPRTTPSTFVRTARSLLERDRYRAIFHADSTDAKGNYTENEAHLRVLNKHAIITMSFVSAARDCTAPAPAAQTPADKHTPPAPTCSILRRWLQPDPADPYQHFTLVTATGRMSAQEAASPLDYSHTFESAHLRSFACQPFQFSDATQHFDPTAASASCPPK